MVSTVLYKKKGVITEDRFKKMTPVQWLFHFVEILENEGVEDKTLLNLLEASNSTLSRDIRILYTLVGENKDQIVNALDIADELDKKTRERRNGKVKEEVKEENKLSSEDEELLEFMYSTPKSVQMPNAMVQEVSYILESKDIDEILDDFTELPEKNYSTINKNIESKKAEEEVAEDEIEEIEDEETTMFIVENLEEMEEDLGFLSDDIEEF